MSQRVAGRHSGYPPCFGTHPSVWTGEVVSEMARQTEFTGLIREALQEMNHRGVHGLTGKRGNNFGKGRMDEAAIANAYNRYLTEGMSIRDLAKELWKRYGYSSPTTCRNSLRYGFRCRGLGVRSRSDAMRKFHGGPDAPSGASLDILRSKTPFGSREYRQAVAAAQKDELTHISPAVAELLSEQELDEQFGWYVRRPWELSLNAPMGENVTLGDLLDDEGRAFSKSGNGRSFSDAWTDVVCAVADRKREIDEWAEAA